MARGLARVADQGEAGGGEHPPAALARPVGGEVDGNAETELDDLDVARARGRSARGAQEGDEKTSEGQDEVGEELDSIPDAGRGHDALHDRARPPSDPRAAAPGR